MSRPDDGFHLFLDLTHWRIWPARVGRIAKQCTTGWGIAWLCIDLYIPTRRYPDPYEVGP